MEEPNSKNTQNMAWWIISLAISVVCCAILFVLFANSLMNIKIDSVGTKDRVERAEQDISILKAQVDILRHRNSVQQIQILPPPGSAPANGVGAAPGQIPDGVVGATIRNLEGGGIPTASDPIEPPAPRPTK